MSKRRKQLESVSVERCKAINKDNLQCGLPAGHEPHPHSILIPTSAPWFPRISHAMPFGITAKAANDALTPEVLTTTVNNYITPQGLMNRLQMEIERDPGTEVKCMLFYLLGKDGKLRELRLHSVQSEARVMSIEFIEEPGR